MTSGLVALTSYFNPFRGERRPRNYRIFRKHLGVPLVAVEWARDGRFELQESDADVVLRVEGGDLMWQKERLLNRGLDYIREHGLARDVAMIDADVVFEDEHWAAKVSEALDQAPVVQCYSEVAYLPELPGVATRSGMLASVPSHCAPSLAYAMGQGKELFSSDDALVQAFAGVKNLVVSGNPGMALAARLHEGNFCLYENGIVGGGDFLVAAGSVGRLDEVFETRPVTLSQQADIRDWAACCLPVGSGLGWADNRLMHLWHGPMAARQYAQRYAILADHDYDPQRDIDRSQPALRFSDSAGGLKEAVAAYLGSRDDA
ncbi:MAG: hypothetical protein HY854_08750 [Burkholderiales bacterium]|nr:hypothetical protein [Burkholderiales bacterium]